MPLVVALRQPNDVLSLFLSLSASVSLLLQDKTLYYLLLNKPVILLEYTRKSGQKLVYELQLYLCTRCYSYNLRL